MRKYLLLLAFIVPLSLVSCAENSYGRRLWDAFSARAPEAAEKIAKNPSIPNTAFTLFELLAGSLAAASAAGGTALAVKRVRRNRKAQAARQMVEGSIGAANELLKAKRASEKSNA